MSNCRNGSSDCGSTVIENKTPGVPSFTALLVFGVTASAFNTGKLSMFVDSLSPGHISEIRRNVRRNVIAVDTTNVGASDPAADIAGIELWTRVPRRSIDSLGGFILDVDTMLLARTGDQHITR